MTLREFLDAAYALIVEAYVRSGMDLFSALEATAYLAARTDGQETPERPPTHLSQNPTADFDAMLKGLA